MARLEEWKPTVCEEADGNAGLDRLQLASKRHLQRVSKSGLLKKFLVEEQNGISIKWDFLNFVIFIEQNGIPFVREGTVSLLENAVHGMWSPNGKRTATWTISSDLFVALT